MNPKIDFLHFQGALLCSFVFHISIECALSDFFWFLLCTHIDHNQISCLRAQIDYESWEFACTMFSCFDCLCTLKIPFCVALITVKSKPLHVSIECAFLDCLLCCFVLTLFTIKFDHLMLRWCVHSQITFSCCFVLTLVTVIFDPFMFGLFVQSETIFVICFVFRLITIKSCFHCLCTVSWLFCLALYSHSSQSNLILSRFDSVCTLRWLLMVALYSHWSKSNVPSVFR